MAEKAALDETPDGMPKELENASLGAVVGGTLTSPAVAGSVWGILYLYRNQESLERLGSKHPSLRFIVDVLRFLFPA